MGMIEPQLGAPSLHTAKGHFTVFSNGNSGMKLENVFFFFSQQAEMNVPCLKLQLSNDL